MWFGDPRDEYVCEETADEVVLMKDEAGQVIGSNPERNTLRECHRSFHESTPDGVLAPADVDRLGSDERLDGPLNITGGKCGVGIAPDDDIAGRHY